MTYTSTSLINFFKFHLLVSIFWFYFVLRCFTVIILMTCFSAFYQSINKFNYKSRLVFKYFQSV